MKRCVFGLVLLMALLGVGLWAQNAVVVRQAEGLRLLEQAADYAVAEQWQSALQCSDKARKCWQDSWPLTAVLADHTPMEDIDCLYAELTVYAQLRDATHYAATCRTLARRVEAVSDAHWLSWQNVL